MLKNWVLDDESDNLNNYSWRSLNQTNTGCVGVCEQGECYYADGGIIFINVCTLY